MKWINKVLWFFGITITFVDRRRFDWEQKHQFKISPYWHAPKCEHCGARPLIFKAGRKISKTEYEAICYSCEKPAKGSNMLPENAYTWGSL